MIQQSVESVGQKSVSYRFEFTRGDDLLAVGKITAVYCRSDVPGQMVSIEIPADMRAKIEA